MPRSKLSWRSRAASLDLDPTPLTRWSNHRRHCPRHAAPTRATAWRHLCVLGVVLASCASAERREVFDARSSWTNTAVLSHRTAGSVLDSDRQEQPGQEVLRVRWRRALTDPKLLEYRPQELASPAMGGGRLYVGSHRGDFYAIGANDGTIRWQRHFPNAIVSRPLYLDGVEVGDELNAPTRSGVVLLGGSDGVLYALDARTGRERWSYRSKGSIVTQPVYHAGLVYFTNGENRVYAIDVRNGTWRWHYERETPDSFTIHGTAGPLVVDQRVYAGFSDGYLVALGAKDGEVVWTRDLSAGEHRFIDVDSTPLLAGGTLYASSYSGGVYAIDPADGVIRWHYTTEGAGTVRVYGDRIFFSAIRDGLHCLDMSGHLLWRQMVGGNGEVAAPVMVGARYLLVSAAASGTFVVDSSSGRLVQFFRPGHGVSSEPLVDTARSHVYVLTNAGVLYAFALASDAT